jgi:hypothetical protein
VPLDVLEPLVGEPAKVAEKELLEPNRHRATVRL